MDEMDSHDKSDISIEVMDSSSVPPEGYGSQFNSSISAKEAKNRYECPICFCFLHDPYITICGHRFCQTCLLSCFEHNENRCPIDNKKLLRNEYFPDNYTKREIDETLVICPNDGCLIPVSAKNYEDHLENCKHRKDNFGEKLEGLDCPYKSVGCDFRITSLPLQLLNHLKNDIMQHVQLLLKEHKILSNSFQNCRNLCPHNETCLQSDTYIDNSPGKLPFYLNDVYEKLTELDQRTTEYTIRLKNMNTKWERSISETSSTKPTTPEKMTNGVLLWEISKFDEVVMQMNKDRNYARYSPMFSTSELGYRFRVRLKLSSNDNDALAILLHVVKGNYDFILKWPFVGEFTISIIHPLDPNLRLTSVIKTNSSDAFQRPVLDINPRGFGFPETRRISDLYKQGYLQDNKLIIVVSAKPIEN